MIFFAIKIILFFNNDCLSINHKLFKMLFLLKISLKKISYYIFLNYFKIFRIYFVQLLLNLSSLIETKGCIDTGK